MCAADQYKRMSIDDHMVHVGITDSQEQSQLSSASLMALV